jgi:SAM-dependent methyltransferase
LERVIYDRMRELEGSHWWFTGRRKVLTALIGDLELPANAKIAEVGCGVGGNIEMLRQFGSVEAVEPDGESRAYIAQRLGLTVQDGLLPDGLPLPKVAFDAVCAFDVVEHVDDDANSVKALAGLVKPGGYLVITVPAYQWMWSHHDVLHHHKRRYRRPAIEALVREAGLTIVRSSYFNGLLFPVAAAVRLAKKALRIETEDDTMPPKTVNALLAGVFASEAGWLKSGARLPFGLSIVVIGRKA